MRTFTLLVLLVFSSTLAFALPHHTKSNASSEARPIRVSLLNTSVQQRGMVLSSGHYLDLPVGRRVDIESRIGATLLIVSNTDSSLDERITIKSSDDAGLLKIR